VRLVLDVVIAVVAGAAENIGLGGLHFLDGDAGSVLAIALRAFRTAEVVLHAVLAAHRILAHRHMIYDTRCYFNVRSNADISQLNLPHGTDNLKSVKTEKLNSKKTDMLRSSSKQSGKSI